MPQRINDGVLHTFATIATYDEIGCKLCDRYGGVITKCEFSIAVNNEADRERLRELAGDIQSDDIARARRTILGAAARQRFAPASIGGDLNETRAAWRVVRH